MVLGPVTVDALIGGNTRVGYLVQNNLDIFRCDIFRIDKNGVFFVVLHDRQVLSGMDQRSFAAQISSDL